MKRCTWPTSDPLMIEYHDAEWGVPLHEDRKIFEFLVLEGMQAGLSWITILRKRENYRQACHQFDPATEQSSGSTRMLSTVSDLPASAYR